MSEEHCIQQATPATPNGQSTVKGSRDVPCTSSRRCLLDLPGEILSQIACHLDLSEQLKFLSLHPALLSLTRTHLSPISPTIRYTLTVGPPYPSLLARLPSCSLFLPDDRGRVFIDVLVRARPRWILERLETGRWGEEIWREAFERRFLRSWRRFKGQEDSWRAIFLRMLSRMEHRNLGCTHEESWTRFVTLHRNGSASINRIYSRLFDPNDIYDELKHQNNFASQPTQVRVLLHLQDVRIIALGVLLTTPSLFVNPNAHLLLHPPLLRDLSPSHNTHHDTIQANGAPRPVDIPIRTPAAAINPSTNTNEAYYPLVRSLSPTSPTTTTYGLGEAGLATSQSTSPSLRTTFSRVLPGRTRRSSSANDQSEEGHSRLGGLLTTVRSRDRDTDTAERRRTWSFGRTRSGSGSTSTPADSLSVLVPTQDTHGIIEPLTPTMPTLPELPSPEKEETDDQSPHTPSETQTPLRYRLPYSRLENPQPVPTYRDYPNYPLDIPMDSCSENQKVDRRAFHDEIEDDGVGALWSATELLWGGDGRKMAEWDEEEETRRRWVGPMIIIAQLHPPDRLSPFPPAAGANGRVEGPGVDLGPKGMYASLGFEDLEDFAPWLELRGGGGNSTEPTRAGLGFG